MDDGRRRRQQRRRWLPLPVELIEAIVAQIPHGKKKALKERFKAGPPPSTHCPFALLAFRAKRLANCSLGPFDAFLEAQTRADKNRWIFTNDNEAVQIRAAGLDITFCKKRSPRDEHREFAESYGWDVIIGAPYTACAYALFPIGYRNAGNVYFETKLLSFSDDGWLSIGLSKSPHKMLSFHGWTLKWWKLTKEDNDAGRIVRSSCRSHQTIGRRCLERLPECVLGDTIGCGYDFRTNNVFFTRNGERVGYGLHMKLNGDIFPELRIGGRAGERCVTNFGRLPFLYAKAEAERQKAF